MTSKADFNAEDWSVVVQAPPLAGMIVITAQRGGTIRETVSMAQAYAEAREQPGSGELLKQIASSSPDMQQSRFGSAEELRERGLQRLRDAVSLLERDATAEELDEYKRFVLSLAEKAANAHREGGFMGVGGKAVSENEQAALDEIAATLGVQRP